MSTSTAPVKTPLGLQELRQRSQGLGQRHRTVLLLVDGRRPLAEVLSMAHQAGATAAHFEDLVRLGMIELPLPPIEELPPADPPPTLPAASMERADAAAVEPPVEAEPAAVPPEPQAAAEPAPAALETPAESVRQAPPAANTGAEPVRGARRRAPGGGRGATAGRAAAARAVPPAASPPAAAAPALPALPTIEPAPAADDLHRLAEARRLLAEVLRRDTLLHRLLAPARVQQAQTQDELIALVWEIERGRAHARRKRAQLLALQRARELLGMGNTLVAEDTLPFEASRLPDD